MTKITITQEALLDIDKKNERMNGVGWDGQNRRAAGVF